MKSLISYFSSVKLAIILLIIITLASTLGTLIPQQRSPEEYATRYGQLAYFLNRLQFTNLYHSTWFITLLILIALNITICTLTRLFPKLRRAFHPNLEFEHKTLQILKTKEKFKKNWTLEKTKAALKKEFSNEHYRIKTRDNESRTSVLARKKTLGLFGSDIVHLGLLIILLGGIASGIGGFRTNFEISEGQILPIPKADFKLRLDKFQTEFYPNGAVRDWKSTLTVIENEKEMLTKIIEVNHPLSYKGYIFYQSSYGWDWENPKVEILAKKSEDPSFLKNLELRLGEKIELNGENLEVSFLHFVPDFVINEKNQVTTRSLEPNNPAVFIEGWQDEEQIFSGWIFAKFPDFAQMHSSKETDLIFELKDIKADQYSGIQMAKDPGVNIIWLGCSILMLGLLLAFFWTPKEIRVLLEDSQGKTELLAGGLATKNKEAFESEFKNIMTSLRRSK